MPPWTLSKVGSPFQLVPKISLPIVKGRVTKKQKRKKQARERKRARIYIGLCLVVFTLLLGKYHLHYYPPPPWWLPFPHPMFRSFVLSSTSPCLAFKVPRAPHVNQEARTHTGRRRLSSDRIPTPYRKQHQTHHPPSLRTRFGISIICTDVERDTSKVADRCPA